MKSMLKIFVSYPINKSNEPTHTKEIISQIKGAIRERGWHARESMEYKNVTSIREKMYNELIEADAVIIDATSSDPNVMYEAGFCSALGIPTIILINRDTFDGEYKERVKAYFDYVDLDKKKTTASGYGDIEYFEYSHKELENEEGEFGFKLGALLDKLAENGCLAYEAVQLRRESKKIFKLTGDFIQKYKWTDPLLDFISAWFTYQVKEFKNMGMNTFRADSYQYSEFLSIFKTFEERRVKAVANVSADEEKFWLYSPQPPAMPPCERIFLMDWKDFRNPELFNRLANTMTLHAGKYKVRFGEVSILPGHNPLDKNAKEGQLLLMPPDLVGGYVDDDGRTFLKVLKDEQVYHKAEEYYSRLVDKTIEVTSQQKPHDIRELWLEKEGIGKWKPDWDEAKLPMDYYENYDKNIRCWIPYYEKFIERCSFWVINEIERLNGSARRELEILEVGFGTGALTSALLEWIDNLNRPFQKPGHVDIPIKAYWGVDSSGAMIEKLYSRCPELKDMADRFFRRGRFWEDLPPEIPNSKKFDVVCGSLVLHDILDENPGHRVKKFLRQCAGRLKPGGSVVFADVFWDNNPDDRKKQMANWKDAMRESGMSLRDIDVFIKYNDEMINTVTEEQLNSAAELTGFLEPGIETGVNGDRKYPFKVLVLRLKE